MRPLIVLLALLVAASVRAQRPGEVPPRPRLAADAGHGTLLAALRRLPEAEAELLAVTELAPYYADAWFLLGMVRDWRGEGDAQAADRTFLARAPRGHPRRAQAEQVVTPAS